jgi:ABC-2 type transport system permease protein
VRSAALAGPPAASAERLPAPAVWRRFPSRTATFCIVELQKLSHDRTELVTRAVQPVLWLLVFGETFNRIHAIPTGGIPYLDFLAPGIIAQSGMFVAIFYGIQIIWERDAGVLTKLLVTPTPRSALILGKSFAAGIRALAQVVVVLVLSIILGVALTTSPLALLGTVVIVALGSSFFACLSMTIAGLVLRRDRLMGIGQMITMPLFFASNALYPVAVMPGWLRALALVNPLSYEVDALRGLLIGTPAHLPLDFAVLTFSVIVGVATASSLVDRLAR